MQVLVRPSFGTLRGRQGGALASAFARIGPESLPSSPSAASDARAWAIAEASGISGRAEAYASSTTAVINDFPFRFDASATASLSPAVDIGAIVGRHNAFDALDRASDATVVIDQTTNIDEQWARVGLNFNSSQVSPSTSIELEAHFESNISSMSPLQHITVSFLDFEIGSEEFADTYFRILNVDDVLVDETFSNAAEAAVFFGSMLDLGMLAESFSTATIDLRFILGTEAASQGIQFGTVFVIEGMVVPEPGTATLLILGLTLMASRRR